MLHIYNIHITFIEKPWKKITIYNKLLVHSQKLTGVSHFKKMPLLRPTLSSLSDQRPWHLAEAESLWNQREAILAWRSSGRRGWFRRFGLYRERFWRGETVAGKALKSEGCQVVCRFQPLSPPSFVSCSHFAEGPTCRILGLCGCY